MIEITAWYDQSRIVYRSETAETVKAAAEEAAAGGASLDAARLVGASLVGASLDGARLVGASLDGASLVGASLDRASLDRASLVGARLVGASLVGARLDGASLVGASLVGASLDRARLVGARLDGASLDGARLNWQSHDLLAEILRRAAGDDVERLKFAGLVLVTRFMSGWCWDKYLSLASPELEWALDELAKWVQDGDGAPDMVRIRRTAPMEAIA